MPVRRCLLTYGASVAQENSDRLQLGDVAPNFQLQASDGSTMQLSDFRGKKVMVCFYRHPFCPICAYTVNNLIGHYKKVCLVRFFFVSALPCFCSSA